jgi:hypothetical protein
MYPASILLILADICSRTPDWETARKAHDGIAKNRDGSDEFTFTDLHHNVFFERMQKNRRIRDHNHEIATKEAFNCTSRMGN